jgi:4-aminobutyrate aminotransferase
VDEMEEGVELGNLLPRIVTPPPGPESKAIAENLKQFESPSLSQIKLAKIPIAWKEAKGANIVDADDNLYVDLSSGYGVATAGYSHPKIVEVIQRQAALLMHAPATYSANIHRSKLVEKLVEITPDSLNMVHIHTCGSEAVENAMKLAKNYSGSQEFIAFEGGFHGNASHGALSLTASGYLRRDFLPLLPGIRRVPYAYCYRCAFGRTYPECDLQCVRYLEHVLTQPLTGVSDVAAVVLEPIQGGGGWIAPPKEFLREIRKICTENNVLLMVDEILTGFGRTGKMFCFEHSDAVPDIMTIGKGMASGFPISGVISTQKVFESMGFFQQVSTFAGMPLACATALTCIEVIEEEGLVKRSERLGEYFMKLLLEIQSRHRIIGDVTGRGLMIGVEIVKDPEKKTPAPKETEEIVNRCLARGVIMAAGGWYDNRLKLSPPLVITEEQLDYSAQALEESISNVEKKL